jgi:succinate dehydrogenase hydrophobic anchor subunit
MATSSIVLVILRWPTLSDLAHYLSPMRRYPSIFWTGVAFLLLLIAMIHAQNRIQREQAQLSKEHV